jgi:MFS transporter, ACS family, tartrate transporter
VAERAVALALRRLLPLLVAMHVIAYLDRVNITFAESQLERDLGLSATAFGLAAGIFFAGYVLLEIPSNLALYRYGARRWLARIMISWGLIAAAGALAWDAASLVVVRVLLGVAEAGFFPGVIFFLSCWFPEARRGEATALFMLGIVIALAVGGHVSGALLELDGVLGVDGWRWLFVLEGLPAVAVGLYALRRLPDRPTEAPWLESADARALERRVAAEESAGAPGRAASLRAVVADRRLQLLAAAGFFLNFGAYGVLFWLADIIERIGGLSDLEVGLIAAIPFTVGSAGLYVLGRGSDRVGDRRRVIAGGLLLGAVGAAGTALLPPAAAIAPLSLGVFGVLGAVAAFWALPAALMSGRAAAGGIALVSAVSVLGGLPGPVVVGVIKDATGSLDWALAAPGVASLLAAALVSAVRLGEPVPAPAPAAATGAGA